MRLFPNNPPSPIIFEIQSLINQNQNDPPQLHCGVLQFTAKANTAQIPYWMTYCLKDHKGNRATEGKIVKSQNRKMYSGVSYLVGL